MERHETTLGRAHFAFSEGTDVDTFVETLARFERGEMDADAWRAYRLVNGAYGQRQEGELSMLRVKVPQGLLSAEQMEAVADVSDRYARGFAHVTTRQNFQFHFLKLSEVGAAMTELADVGMTTREACGNAVRNVTGPATAGVADDEVFDPIPYAEAFTRYFLRHKLASGLPRKFKVAFAGGGADHAFALVNDIGWHARIRDGRRGFRVTVAGGTAIMCTSGYELFDFLPANDIFAVAEALLLVFNARGDREHRHKNRLKFLVKQMGWGAFREAVHVELAQLRAKGVPPLPFDPEAPEEREHPPTTRAPAPTEAEIAALAATDKTHGPGIMPRHSLPIAGDDRGKRFLHTNVRPQKQAGYSVVTVVLPLGDITSARLRILAKLARAFGDGSVRTTHGQNMLLRWVPTDRVAALYTLLRRAGLGEPDPETIADVSSCPGAESCKLAVTQSRGLADVLSTRFREDRARVDRAAGLVVKVSGCPNGCGLHHVAGIGFQGGLRKVDGRPVPQYFVFVGGDAGGDTARFGRVVAKVPARRAAEVIERLTALYEKNGAPDESMTAWLGRAKTPELKAALADLEKLEAAQARPEDFVDLGETEAFAPVMTEGECAA